MPKLKSYGVFISHAWTYNADYYRLVGMLNKAERFKWRNCSVPEHDPLDAKSNAELEEALHNQIRPAKVVLVISGMYVNHRKWIQKEIDIALEMNKPIVGLIPWGAERTPAEVQEIAPMVRWDTSSIVAAIRKPARPERRRRSGEDADRPDVSELLDWIQRADDSSNYDVHVSGETVKMRGGMGG